MLIDSLQRLRLKIVSYNAIVRCTSLSNKVHLPLTDNRWEIVDRFRTLASRFHIAGQKLLQTYFFAYIRNFQFEESTNRNVQIVMKRGLIEVPMSGKMFDFNSCILIHRTDVDDINVVIKRAGSKKLKAMVNAAQFRRKIIAQEWDHKALKLKIRDLKDQVKMIEKCKITKEVQEWLKRKEMGVVEDLGQLALEREIENTIYAQEKMLLEV